MSDLDANLIDRIVRDVMARLCDRDRGASTGTSTNDALVLNEPVLTEESLAARVNGHRAIVVGRKTVLTPTARDFLRKREITFTRRGETAAAATRTDGDRLAIVAVNSETVASAVAALGWARRSFDCWKRAAGEAVAALRSGTAGVVLFTEQDAAAGCLANRNADVRAAIVDDAHGVRAAREMLGPNLLVVDPAGKSFVDLRGILVEFATGSTEAPPGWGVS